MKFRARVFDTHLAQTREEWIESESREALGPMLLGRGLTLLSASAHDARSEAPAGRLDLEWWCRELRTLLVAGMTVVEALDTLAIQGRHAQDALQQELLSNVRRGLSLSSAMEATGGFPPVLVSGVKAGERTGELVRALDDFLSYHAVLEQLRRQVLSAAIYPAIVVMFGFGVALFLLFFVTPRFSRMYGDLHGSLSWATQLLLALSRALYQHGPLVGAAVALLVLGVTAAWRTKMITRAAMAFSEGFAPLRRRIDDFRLAMLFHALSLLFRGGYTLDESLKQARALMLGARLREGVRRAEEYLAQGRKVSDSFADAGLADPVSRRLLAVGERGSSFDRILQTIGERHAAEFKLFVERLTRIVEPLLLLIVALVVGGIVVLMYMPIFDMASSVR